MPHHWESSIEEWRRERNSTRSIHPSQLLVLHYNHDRVEPSDPSHVINPTRSFADQCELVSLVGKLSTEKWLYCVSGGVWTRNCTLTWHRATYTARMERCCRKTFLAARGLTWSQKRTTRKSADTRRNSASLQCSDLANCNTTCREQETEEPEEPKGRWDREAFTISCICAEQSFCRPLFGLWKRIRGPLCCLSGWLDGWGGLWSSTRRVCGGVHSIRHLAQGVRCSGRQILMVFRTQSIQAQRYRHGCSVRRPACWCEGWQLARESTIQRQQQHLYAGVRPLCLYWLNNSIGSFSFYYVLPFDSWPTNTPTHAKQLLEPAGWGFFDASTIAGEARWGSSLAAPTQVGRCSSVASHRHYFMCDPIQSRCK